MKSSNRRGEFGFGSFVMTAIFVFVVAVCVKYAQAFGDKAKVEALLTQTILANKQNPTDPLIVDKIVSGVKQVVGATVNGADVIIYTSSDNNHVRIELNYQAPIRIFGIGWDQRIDAAVSEILRFQ